MSRPGGIDQGSGGVSPVGGRRSRCRRSHMYQVASGSGRGPEIAAALALLLALSPRVVRGEGGGRAEGGAAPCPDPRCFEEERVWIHSASARYDVGSASAYGLGYMFGRAVIHSGYPDLFSIGHLSL